MTSLEFKQARQNLGLTQVQLADTLGMTRQHISFLERGIRDVQKQTVLAMKYLENVLLTQ